MLVSWQEGEYPLFSLPADTTEEEIDSILADLSRRAAQRYPPELAVIIGRALIAESIGIVFQFNSSTPEVAIQ